MVYSFSKGDGKTMSVAVLETAANFNSHPPSSSRVSISKFSLDLVGIFGCLSEDFLKVLLSRQTGGSLEEYLAGVAKATPIFQDLFYKHKDI